MDGNLLRSWLGLPPGPWPPDDRTLLGLPDHADPAEVERRALMLMARLRPHQLLHPELVTEGMNRLAQAMLAVTTFGVSKPAPVKAPQAAPKATSSAAPTAPKQPVPIPKATTKPKSVEPFDFSPGAGVEAAPPMVEAELATPRAAPEILNAEAVVLDAEAVYTDRFAGTGPAIQRPAAHSVEGAWPSLLPEVLAIEKPRIGPTASDRRKVYRELVAWRRLLSAWDQLRPWLGHATAELDSPAAIFDFLEAVQACRIAQLHLGLRYLDWHDEIPLLQKLLDQPQILPVFRALVHGQRQALATDWARARSRWEETALELRLAIRGTVRNLTRPWVTGMVRWFSQNPEWLLAIASLTVLFTGFLRLVLGQISKSTGPTS